MAGLKKISEKILLDGEWLTVIEMMTENRHGAVIRWETVKRKKMTVGVVILARLMPSRRFVLVKQWRPNAEGYVIGFPAGYAFGDPTQALVELKEETGYTGKITSVSPVLKAGAGILHDSAILVAIDIDEKDPVNQNPEQNLEPAEDIEVCLVTKENARAFLLNEQNLGHHVSLNLWMFLIYQDLLY